MNIAQLGTMESMQKVANNDSVAINVLEVVTDEEALIAQNIDAAVSNGDELAAARPSGYNKTEYDDAVGAFFKEMARYPLLKPDEEVELARRVRILEEVRQAQAAVQEKFQLGYFPDKAAIAKEMGIAEKQLEHRLYQGKVAKIPLKSSSFERISNSFEKNDCSKTFWKKYYFCRQKHYSLQCTNRNPSTQF